MFDTVIIGAGLSGLSCALNLSKMDKVLILDKSRGVGGRMATRRTLETKFDHGAQFYRLKSEIANLHQEWLAQDLSNLWFSSELGQHWNSKSGMTSFAKFLASSLEIQLENEVSKISKENDFWKLTTLNNKIFECKKLIFSSPVPQTLAILERSQLLSSIEPEKYNALKELNYSKALILLLTLQEDLNFNQNGYEEFNNSEFFSIADQKRKGVSSIPAYTLTMSEDFSQKFFDLSDQISHEAILEKFIEKFPDAKIVGSELKKWRYCQIKSAYKELFCEVLPQVYMIGDAFGGASLLGAIRSAKALNDYFVENAL